MVRLLKNTLHLKRSLNAYGEITSGKNDNARRSFYLTAFANAVLASQKELLKNLGISSDDYVFCDQYGDPIKQRNYYSHWKRYCKNNNISDTTPYELRHIFVSAVKSIPEGYLKQVVGHNKDMDTYGTYSHEVTAIKKPPRN